MTKEEKQLMIEREKYEKDKLRRYKILDDLREQSAKKGQFTASINAEYRSGQLAGMYIDHKQITHSTLEGMSRDQLEKRLKELSILSKEELIKLKENKYLEIG